MINNFNLRIEWFVILGLLIWVVVSECSRPDPIDPEKIELETKIKHRDQAVHELQALAVIDREKRKADSVAYTKEIQTYKDRDKKRVSEIARIKASKVVIQVRDSVPEIDGLIVAYDSLIAGKDQQIETQATYINKLEVDISKVTDNFVERLSLQSETIADQAEIIKSQGKQLRKENRKKAFWKVVAVIAGGAGIFGGSQL